jgi:hypothetical protein
MKFDVEAVIGKHRCSRHPIFEHWAQVPVGSDVLGALFHQIQSFCAATRPGGKFPEGLRLMGGSIEAELLDSIVESEDGHGVQLATMAAYVINREAGHTVIPDVHDQAAVEEQLRLLSNSVLATLPGYDDSTGLSVQARRAMALFDSRERTDRESTLFNLGVAVALECISNRHLIPGEKMCLIDSGLYGVSLEDPEMHYLKIHWGEVGAEAEHEQNALRAVALIGATPDDQVLILRGVESFLDSLCALWDFLDTALLQSGYVGRTGSARHAVLESA